MPLVAQELHVIVYAILRDSMTPFTLLWVLGEIMSNVTWKVIKSVGQY